MGHALSVSSSAYSDASCTIMRLWGKTGPSFGMIMIALKGSIPPIFAIAIYQEPKWVSIYTTLGYFVAIVAMLTMAMQPRAKFFQTVFTMAIFVSLAAAVSLLVILCATLARNPANNSSQQHGSSGSTEATPYDSSANAVAATWLFINVFFSNYLKFKRPQPAAPVLQFSIYSIVAAIYTPSFATMSADLNFTRRLFVTFLTAYGIAAVVNIVIWPTTSRGEVKRQSLALTCTLKDCIHLYKTYLTGTMKTSDGESGSYQRVHVIEELKQKSREASDLFGNIDQELDFARKEIGYGKLRPDQLHQLYVGLREMLQPIISLSTFLQNVVNTQFDDIDICSAHAGQATKVPRDMKLGECNDMTAFCDAHIKPQEVIVSALDHISIQVGLLPRTNTNSEDAEKCSPPQLGDLKFVQYLQQQLHDYRTTCDSLTREYFGECSTHVTPRQQNTCSSDDETIVSSSQPTWEERKILLMYLNFLVYNTGQTVLHQVNVADGLVIDGTMKRNRVIFPGCRSLARLMMGAMTDTSEGKGMGLGIHIGDDFDHEKDPEHMTPTSLYGKVTDQIRCLPQLLSSAHAGFGLHSAVTTLSIALAGFLAPTRPFSLEQRGVWAVSMTATAMTPRFGASIFKFAMRILGTAIAAGLSFAATYVADHNRIGVVVLLYFQLFGWLLLTARLPSFQLTGIVGAVTAIVIVGY